MSHLQDAMQTVATRTQGLHPGGAEINMASADLIKQFKADQSLSAYAA